ncbi:Cuticle protein 19 [Frankliniella fusca]|uniref:Cuticle protein 19 n=1 Tax=Frankliniella fusca TaxID=407009 RepID=A0AAE1H7A2_9NEOP|nr:Cuticle protein 19 [Frankliniella fusca]
MCPIVPGSAWIFIVALTATVASAVSVGSAGIASGLHRRLDGAGFLSPQEDDFFADYKDLVTPPKDLLETPKDLLDTPKDLVETPKDLTDTPKDLLDDHDDLEAFAEHGAGGGGEHADQHDEVDSTHPKDDDTAAHDELADLSLAQHLKNSDKEYGREEEPSGEHLEAPAPPSPFSRPDEHDDDGVRAAFGSAAARPASGPGARAPFQHGAGRTAYAAAGPAALRRPVSAGLHGLHGRPVVKNLGYNGHPSSPLRAGDYGELEHEVGRVVRPEYAYRYGVHDPSTQDVKSAWEQRDGEDTRGGYALVEPNGRTRVVEYSVTKGGGFNAKVKHLPPGHRGG